MRQIELLVQQQKKEKMTWKGYFIVTNVWKLQSCLIFSINRIF